MARFSTEGLTDDFNIENILTPERFLGFNSAYDKTALAPGFLIRGSVNTIKKLSGTYAAREGIKLRGTADSTLAKVDSSFEWNTWNGRCLPLRISNGNLQVESDIVSSGTYVWYTLLSSLTTTRWVFDSWWDNTNKKDVLLMADGTAKLRFWSGAAALFVSYAINVITLDRDATTAGFTSGGGTVIISGTTYTYTGISGSTLTGTSDASAVAANSAVFDVPGSSTFSSTPPSTYLADFLRVINNRVWIGSYTSRIFYGSKTSSYSDFSQSSPRVPGDGETITADGTGKGIGIRNGNPWFSAGTSDWYEVTFNQITVSTTLTEQTVVKKQPVSGLQAALGHEFIEMIGNNIIAMCQDQQLRMIGIYANTFENKYPSLSLDVQDYLSNEDFTGGHVKAVGNIIYITAPNSGIDYMYEARERIDNLGRITQERLWHTPQVRNISRFALINGVVFGHSNTYPQIYQIWDTNQWHDDSPNSTTSGVPYDVKMRFAYRNGNRRQGKNNFDKTYYEGYITEGTKLYGNVYFDYQGASGISSLDLNSLADIPLYSGVFPASLGDSSLGDLPLGDGLLVENNDQELLPKFRIIKDVPPTDNFEYALELYTSDLDSRWELLAIGTNEQISDMQAVEIRR